MILLLGASGYIGRAFASELRRRGHLFIPLTSRAFDYANFNFLFDYLRTMKPRFLINAAHCSGPFNGSVPEAEREKMMAANAILPQMIARACLITKTPWAHVSSGSIYSGAKVLENEKVQVERDLDQTTLSRLFETHPDRFFGYTEIDEPNFSFRDSPCNFYSGTKALAEEAVREIGQNYIWRLRQAFNERDEPRNFLRQLLAQGRIYNHINSLSHLDDGVKACLDLWQIGAPFGIYNVTNPGVVTGRQIGEAMQRILKRTPHLKISNANEDPCGFTSKNPQSNCILDSSKLLRAGVRIRTIHEAVEDCLGLWQETTQAAKAFEGRSLYSPADLNEGQFIAKR